MRIFRNISLVFLALLSLVTVTTIVRAQTTADANVANVKRAVEYPLPYPGILPDNVLYSLKALRDRAIEFLTIDPLKKAEFFLLQADKRVASAQTLSDKGKFLLAEQTVSKAEKYFLRTLDQANVAKARGKDTRDLEDRMKRAAAKHDEIITLLLTRMPKEFKTGLGASRELLKGIEDTFVIASPSGQTSY